MSSVTSTKGADASSPAYAADATTRTQTRRDEGLRPWQFFVLAALGCATAVTWMARSQGVTTVVLLSVLMGAAALAGLAMFRMVMPLVSPEEERVAMIGERTRAAFEREKNLTLRAIKELEFDRAMKKLSEEDFREMGGKLRARATRLMRQIDAGAGYRDKIERDLSKRLGERTSNPVGASSPGRSAVAGSDVPMGKAASSPAAAEATPNADEPIAVRTCATCATVNDPDARFCKECGGKL